MTTPDAARARLKAICVDDAQVQVIEVMLAQARAEGARAERAVIDKIIDEWEAAYPEDTFRPFIATDHPNVSPDRIAAQMGRHIAREIRKQLAALRAQP